MATVYGFDPVAWSIDGGRHRGELLRVLAYASTGGSEGVVSPGDCRVHQLTTPGTQVAIDAGAILIRNRSANARNQTYVANGRSESRLDVPASGGTTRRHLVIVRVEDPQYSPWPTPSSAAAPDYQYVKPFLITDVPAGTTSALSLNLGYSAYALARIDVPAGVSTISDTHITNLRELANPRSHRAMFSNNVGAAASTLSSTSFIRWPNIEFRPFVPSWATHAEGRIDIGGIIQLAALADAEARVRIGTLPASGVHYLDNDGFSDGNRFSMTMTGSGELPTSQRGVEIPFYVEARCHVPGRESRWRADIATSVGFDIQFSERAV